MTSIEQSRSSCYRHACSKRARDRDSIDRRNITLADRWYSKFIILLLDSRKRLS